MAAKRREIGRVDGPPDRGPGRDTSSTRERRRAPERDGEAISRWTRFHGVGRPHGPPVVPREAMSHPGRRIPGGRIDPLRASSDGLGLTGPRSSEGSSSKQPQGRELRDARCPGHHQDMVMPPRVVVLDPLTKLYVFLVVIHVWVIIVVVNKSFVLVIETLINIPKHTLFRGS